MDRKRAGNIWEKIDQPRCQTVQKWWTFQYLVILLCFHLPYFFFFSSAIASFHPFDNWRQHAFPLGCARQIYWFLKWYHQANMPVFMGRNSLFCDWDCKSLGKWEQREERRSWVCQVRDSRNSSRRGTIVW